MDRLTTKLLSRLPPNLQEVSLAVGDISWPNKCGPIHKLPGVSYEARGNNGKNHKDKICCQRITGDRYERAREVATEIWSYLTARDVRVKLVEVS